MNFTREPIIETIITPKEGHKLVIRNTKASGSEEYIVDAIEVVSFGKTHFFRSTERPKPFLVPVSDYEVVEAKETRVVLKNATFERQIKIGGGKSSKEKQEAEPAEVEERLDKKRERRRHRRRRTPGETGEEAPKAEEVAKEAKPAEGGGADDETLVSSSVINKLIPPPTTLISQTLSQEKTEDAPPVEGDVLPEPQVKPEAEEKPKRGRRKKKVAEEKPPEDVSPPEDTLAKEEKPPAEESGDMNRVAAEPVEAATSTSFSSIEKKEKSSFFGKIW